VYFTIYHFFVITVIEIICFDIIVSYQQLKMGIVVKIKILKNIVVGEQGLFFTDFVRFSQLRWLGISIRLLCFQWFYTLRFG